MGPTAGPSSKSSSSRPLLGRAPRPRSAAPARRAGPPAGRAASSRPARTAASSAAHSTSSSRVIGKRRPSGVPPELVAGAPHALEERGDGARRADLAHELDRPDVDAQLEGGRRHERPQVPGPQSLLDPQAAVLREAPVVRRRPRSLGPQPLAQEMGESLRQPPGVDEHQRRPVVAAPSRRCGRGSRSTARGWRPPRAPCAAARCRRRGAGGAHSPRWRAKDGPVPSRTGAGPPPRGAAGWPRDRCAAAAHRFLGQQRPRRSRRQGQVGAPLVSGQRVHLVDDHRPHPTQPGPATRGGEQQVQATRGW